MDLLVLPSKLILMLSLPLNLTRHPISAFDFVQTGFEFKKRRAFPIIEGVVVAAANEAIILEVMIISLSRGLLTTD